MALALTNPTELTYPSPLTTDDLTGSGKKKVNYANTAAALSAGQNAANAAVASAPLSVTPPDKTTITAPQQAPVQSPSDFFGVPKSIMNGAAPAPAAPLQAAADAPVPSADQEAPQITQSGGSLDLGSPTSVPPTLEKPGYAASSVDPITGMPNATSGSLTKLGKLLTVLRMAGQGAAAGSQSNTFGGGFAAATRAADQQAMTNQALQHGGIENQIGRQTLQNLPWTMQQQRMMGAANLADKQADASYKAEHAKYLAQIANVKDIPTLQQRHSQAVQDEVAAGRDPQKSPKVQAYADAITSLQKEKPETDIHATVNTAQGVKQYNPVTKRYDIPVGGSPITMANSGAGTSGPPGVMTPELQARIAALTPPQQAVLARYDPKTQSALLAVARGDEPKSIFPPRLTHGAPGITQQDAQGIVQQINPGYDDKLYSTKQALQKNYTNSTGSHEGAQINSFNIFLGHAADASDVASAYNQTGSPLLNKPLNWIRSHAAGNPGYTELTQALYPVREEYIKFLKGSFAPQKEELEHINTIMSDDSTPAQIQVALKEMGKQAVVRLDSLNENYKTVTGENWPNLIHANRVTQAQKLGLGEAIAGYGIGGQLPGNMPKPQTSAPSQQAATGYTRIKASDGSLHDIPNSQMDAARRRDPKLQVQK